MPKTLKMKMTLVVSLLVAGMLAGTMLTVLWYLAGQFMGTVSRQQLNMTTVIADEIDSKITLSQRQLMAVARTITAYDLATPQRAARFLGLQPDELEAFDNGISLLSGDGRLLATIPDEPRLIGRNFLDREHLKKSIVTGRPVISRPFVSLRSHRHPVVTFTAPVFDRKGKVIALLCGSEDLMKPNYLGKLAAWKLEGHGFIYLVNGEGTIMVHPDSAMLLRKEAGRNRLLDAALRGFEGTGETVDGKGRHLLSSFKRLKSADWIVSVNYLQSDAYAPLKKATWYLVSAIIAAIACSIPVTWFFMRHLTSPLHAFIGHVERITGKEQEPEPIVIERQDEIGTLALAFNRMVHEAHRQKEAALAQEAFCENLLQSSSVATYVIDSRHRVIMWNRACEELTGVRAADVLETDEAWRAFYPEKRPVLADFVLTGAPPDLSAYYSSCGSSPLAPGGLTAEGWFPNLYGHERFLCFDAAPILDADNNVVAAIETLRDITERKEAEESLQKLSLAIEQMPVTVMITDREGVIEYVNPHFTKVTGYLPEEAIGNKPSLVRSGWHPPEFFKKLWDTILSGKEWRGELRNKRKDGELYWESASISLVKDPSGDIRHFVAVKEDITERKRAEEALRNKDEQIRLLLESTAEAIYGLDLSGACTFANPSCAKLLGYGSPDELLGKNMHHLIHHTRIDGTTYPAEQCPLCHVLRGEGGVHVTDEIFWRPDGSCFFAEYWSYPQMRDGEVVGGVVTFFDVTERRRAEEEVRRASAAAEAAARAKSQFLANMSHEIRTPLNASLGMLYLLQQTPLTGQQRNYLDKAHTASTMLLKLINDILDFSKIEAGKLELENVPFRLGFVLNDLAAVATATLQNKPITLSVRVAPDVPDLLVGDPLRLSQVLLNLISNAVKFTREGRIDVDVALLQEGEAKDLILEFSVTDTGIGIPSDKQAALFNAFTQADNSTTRRYGGTGLGLTISKDLVQLMGGAISVSSREGEGSTFSFTARVLRQSKEQAQQARQRPEAPARPQGEFLRGVRILLVEDMPVNQEVAREILQRGGAQVEVARHGAHAIEKLKGSAAFDAVLMDVHMPVMDGLEATRQIRLDPRFRRLPIIAMTANAMTEDRERCRGAGMTDHVNKPIDPDQLFATLRRWIDPMAPLTEPAAAGRCSGVPERLPGIDLKAGLAIVESRPLFARLLKTFHAENSGAREEVEMLVASKERESARGKLHSLKGVAGNLGFTELARAAGALEQALKNGAGREEQEGLLGRVGEELAQVLASIALLEEQGMLQSREGTLPPEGTVQRDDLAALARELHADLQVNNLAALKVWETMRGMLSGEAAERLDATLQSLDFRDASRLLDEMMQEWGIEL